MMPKQIVTTRYKAYCLTCKGFTYMKNQRKEFIKFGRKAIKGECPKCNRTLFTLPRYG